MIGGGELAALGAATSWALCSLGFAAAGARIGAAAVNQVRIVLAVVLLAGVHVVVAGPVWPAMGGREVVLLAVSGVVGLGLGDLCYFHALARLGPRTGALLMGTWPVMAAVLAWGFRGEVPTGRGGVGVLLTIGGVGIVVGGSRREDWSGAVSGRARRRAVAAGLLGALGQAVGIVLSKEALVAGVPALSATVVRMVAGAVAAVALGMLAGGWGALRRGMRDRAAVGFTAFGALFGPVLGVWLSLVAVAGTHTGTAAALMATTPVLLLPIGRVAYGAPITRGALAGTVLAVAGAVLLVAGGG